MRIKQLNPRLSNQIAAGEVVERPSSVVKELVENALDAHCTRMDIDLEAGGTKLIRIRDDGDGIYREDLTLAMSRHATSKIEVVDDLEAIDTLGFRGEALASIASIAKGTMTSRRKAAADAESDDAEDTAWQVTVGGSLMTPELVPAPHPVGTTVEVKDLFYNKKKLLFFIKRQQDQKKKRRGALLKRSR